MKICSNCIRILDRLNKIKFLENNMERLEKKLRNQIISEHLSSSRLDLLKLKIKCEEKNLKCVNRMFKKQVKIVVKKTDYNKTANNIELIKKLISPKVILLNVMVNMEENKSEKVECIHIKKNEMKQETHEEKLQRYIFEACERCVSNPDSETEFDTIFEQCASEKSKKVKIKENGDRKSHQT